MSKTMPSLGIRDRLREVLQLDLVGPGNDHEYAHELLPQSPQRWYLTGYLVPQRAPEEERKSKDEPDDEAQPVDEEGQPDRSGNDDSDQPEPAVRVSYLPPSMGMSVLTRPASSKLAATIRWGDYLTETEDDREADPDEIDRAFEEEIGRERAEAEAEAETGKKTEAGDGGEEKKRKLPKRGFRREPRREQVVIELSGDDGKQETEIMNSRGLKLVASWRALKPIAGTVVTAGTKALSVFVVNDRECKGRMTFHELAFQVELELACEEGFVGRPDLRGTAFQEDADADERIADLHYRDVLEYAVGHGVSTRADEVAGQCGRVRTVWMPSEEVARVEHAGAGRIGETVADMEALGALEDGKAAEDALNPLVSSYRGWIAEQEAALAGLGLSEGQKQTAEELIIGAKAAAERIELGIKLLADPMCLEAFRISNRAMARSARQRFGPQQGKKPEDVNAPKWHVFQLAFILMNLDGLFNPESRSRKIVDLLFFPTGGGKTEAYLGLAAFALIVRRLRRPGISSAGVSILMRYTLRLLTLDQLGRAAALMCALELERKANKNLGEWPFEIGLWVGSAATPNKMGKQADTSPGKDRTAYTKLMRFQREPAKHPCPIPLEECPWCGTKFTPECFRMEPNGVAPRDLVVSCDNMHCEFAAANNASLPIVGVDEPIYRRLPCFIIATVDKFAALPWTGRVGALFGMVERYDQDGFYGACDPGRGAKLPEGRLLPPDLIIQDELHLISGPLGTIAGIYEAAIEKLCSRDLGNGRILLPKIVASTATVRRADRQIRALFGRCESAIFPPPGPSREDSFFAKTVRCGPESPGRLYVGVAAQGRSMKVVLLRTALALLSGAKELYEAAGGAKEKNPCDPYMTLLAYFNSLRELGGSRRIVEDEVYGQVQARWRRRRYDPEDGLFRDRYISRTPVELTSRVSTNEVALARRRLAMDFSEAEKVDVALATNMISVGLDIIRLGLMVVYGQPKTSSEYIQATSRVGRDKGRPGLVVTLLNIHKPRDRSHYERFGVYHRTFYRAVEASSVTPFSPRALDRGLAAALVGACRHGVVDLEPAERAGMVGAHLPSLQALARLFAKRALMHDGYKGAAELDALEAHVDDRAQDLLSKWCEIAARAAKDGGGLGYQKYEGARQGEALIRDFLDPELDEKPDVFRCFRANRSMRDVEAGVDILITRR